jgi:hypothetical protein
MTTLVKSGASPAAADDPRMVATLVGARLLIDRLHQESDRQVPFSSAKLLLREAASAIERLDTELSRLAAELDDERASWQARRQGAGAVVKHDAQ